MSIRRHWLDESIAEFLSKANASKGSSEPPHASIQVRVCVHCEGFVLFANDNKHSQFPWELPIVPLPSNSREASLPIRDRVLQVLQKYLEPERIVRLQFMQYGRRHQQDGSGTTPALNRQARHDHIVVVLAADRIDQNIGRPASWVDLNDDLLKRQLSLGIAGLWLSKSSENLQLFNKATLLASPNSAELVKFVFVEIIEGMIKAKTIANWSPDEPCGRIICQRYSGADDDRVFLLPRRKDQHPETDGVPEKTANDKGRVVVVGDWDEHGAVTLHEEATDLASLFQDDGTLRVRWNPRE